MTKSILSNKKPEELLETLRSRYDECSRQLNGETLDLFDNRLLNLFCYVMKGMSTAPDGVGRNLFFNTEKLVSEMILEKSCNNVQKSVICLEKALTFYFTENNTYNYDLAGQHSECMGSS